MGSSYGLVISLEPGSMVPIKLCSGERNKVIATLEHFGSELPEPTSTHTEIISSVDPLAMILK